jgi:hypothetical protein
MVELSAHDVVVMPCHDGDGGARLPVPDAHRLIVRARQYPRVLMVELNSADIVEVPKEREDAATELVVPHLSDKGNIIRSHLAFKKLTVLNGKTVHSSASEEKGTGILVAHWKKTGISLVVSSSIVVSYQQHYCITYV